ncbi:MULTISPECIES: outer membrane lipoprotein carrier protein LolA [unclassified Pseudodesulfovibrio]|uniref:LolA family protein n=1 Tax=unclassified Pseudodesulfovibrio TaxID=2661612 RepID=UPI000FEBAF6A|nr:MULTISPECIES: outer membrane lipoprotein carrier protein LolA [unclassified Pseudodesulfovibrio]MCJ2163827.1 outer membrane lipoprotein carrier protein LolA [Pseudodesulfovibrio sp. S3-i]RWU05926.1 outer membrane lipoprotein carrier protein LolA [Pseudodesulfovibrio sp. S3]
MSKLYIAICTTVLTLAFPLMSMAAEAVAPEDLPDLIQQRYETLKTFRADFVQELTNVASGEVETREGKISFRQPSQVRWETTAPEKELLIVGKEVAWNYIEDEELAIKYSVATLLNSKTILRFISGQANIKEDFVVKTEWAGADEVRSRWGKGFVVLQLVPKEAEPGMVLAFVGVEPATGLLRQVMIVDFYGNGNELRLSNVEVDVNLNPEMFTFVPPEGTQVEDNTEGI